ncbi:MAG: Signal peptidase I [Candidatus Kaiserbacteria bacterium GW2011_GWA2_49_19]|uniref:Signal peptidase I n=1 Tax=Candidatus Kaiserbacteria bacterium GW2011_GWA2_49_19 TaxID=1618669 RepID=A0A0G1YPD4_9BACT|nr:MAG: Signal peptidase I [Candidatus Kaiserbacteria bacterium GW2011_GWA2_49_19]
MLKNFFNFVWETLKIVIIALAIVVPIRYFIFQPFIVKGQSMEPNFQEGNYLIIDEVSYRWRNPQRGEVVVFKYPYNPSQRYIKRIIGLPGEVLEIRNEKVMIFDQNGQEMILQENTYLPQGDITLGNLRLTLKENEYFVLGDNRLSSSDSRSWGVLPRDKIIGRVLLRLWPPAEASEINLPTY